MAAKIAVLAVLVLLCATAFQSAVGSGPVDIPLNEWSKLDLSATAVQYAVAVTDDDVPGWETGGWTMTLDIEVDTEVSGCAVNLNVTNPMGVVNQWSLAAGSNQPEPETYQFWGAFGNVGIIGTWGVGVGSAECTGVIRVRPAMYDTQASVVPLNGTAITIPMLASAGNNQESAGTFLVDIPLGAGYQCPIITVTAEKVNSSAEYAGFSVSLTPNGQANRVITVGTEGTSAYVALPCSDAFNANSGVWNGTISLTAGEYGYGNFSVSFDAGLPWAATHNLTDVAQAVPLNSYMNQNFFVELSDPSAWVDISVILNANSSVSCELCVQLDVYPPTCNAQCNQDTHNQAVQTVLNPNDNMPHVLYIATYASYQFEQPFPASTPAWGTLQAAVAP